MNYTGLKCPVCGRTFAAGDDIVVCPQCGAPYHRECYAKEGRCIYSDAHGTANAWKPPAARQGDADADDDMPRCPRCGAKNAKNALFCSHCGLPLSPNGSQPYSAPFPGNRAPSGNEQRSGARPPENGYPENPFPFQYDPLGGVNPNQPIDGVPASEVGQFVQSNTQYYLPVFANLSHFGRNRFNFTAFLFTGLWMLYRKQYRKGIVFSVVPAVLWIAYFYLCRFWADPIMSRLFELAGISQSDSLFDATQRMALFQQFYALPSWQRLLLLLPDLLLLVLLIFKMILGFGGNRMYLQYCVSTTKRIHSEVSDPTSVAIRMQEKGGINTTLAACLGICWFIAFLLLSQSI